MENYRGFLQVFTNQEEGYYSFLLADEVYKYAQDDLDDLRLVDQEGKVIAYYIVDGSRVEHINKEVKATFVYSFSKDGWSYYDMQMGHFDKEPYYDHVIDFIQLESNGKDFASEVEIMGSYDKERFTPISSDVIYRVDAGEKLGIQLQEETNYSFYRIGFKESEQVLQLIGAKAYKTNLDEQAALKKKVNLPFEVQKQEGYTLLKVKNENRLQFDTLELVPEEMKSGKLFDRDVAIRIGNEESGYITLGNGRLTYVDLKDTQIKLNKLELQQVLGEPYFEIKIDNKDNESLTFGKDGLMVEAIQHKVVFEGKSEEGYKLYFGNELAELPAYDIQQFKESIEKEEQYDASIGKSTIEEKPIVEVKVNQKIWENKWLMNGAIGVIAILLLWIIIKNYKKALK